MSDITAGAFLDEVILEINKYFDSHELPKYFYECLFGEVIKMNGVKFLIPNAHYYDESDNESANDIFAEDYSYKDQLDYFICMYEGTAGWYEAFKQSCIQCNMKELLDYYKTLDWIHSDLVDDYIGTHMIDCLLSKDHIEQYYKYYIKNTINDN